MTIEGKVREILLSEELSAAEKLDRLHALIPPDAVKIDNLNQATPAQLKRLKDGLAVSEAMQQIRRAELLAKERGRSLLKTSATQGDVGGFDEGRDAVAYLKPHVLH
jgi:hypothetical protein